MSGSTNKKALIQRFEKENIYCYLNLGAYLQPNGVEAINLSGTLLVIPYEEIKSVSLVREFEAPDPNERKILTNRPKSPGLWVRMRFRDQEQIDGLMANQLHTMEPYGFSFTPADPGSNCQRMFVPRRALIDFQVLAVVGSPQYRQQKPKAKPVPKEQLGLFE